MPGVIGTRSFLRLLESIGSNMAIKTDDERITFSPAIEVSHWEPTPLRCHRIGRAATACALPVKLQLEMANIVGPGIIVHKLERVYTPSARGRCHSRVGRIHT
jgi:hypothetical protein